MEKPALLFDLDGTLLDTIADIAAALNRALSLFGYPTYSVAEVLQMVGNGTAVLLSRALPNGADNPDYSRVLVEYKTYYAAHTMVATAPYDGILPLLDRLLAAGFRIGIVSNKFDSAVKELASRFFGGAIPVAIGESRDVPRKPAPDGVRLALRALGEEGLNAVLIGDSEVDIETARAAGIPCLSVGWGFRSREELMACGAERVFATPGELAEYLLS